MEKHLSIITSSASGNTLDVTARAGHCGFEIEHPWYGDSESGFGVTLYDNLTPAQAHALGSLLVEWAESEGFRR